MKRVFVVDVKDNFETLLSSTNEFTVFAESILEAVEKVNQVISEKQNITKARLLCVVEEDSDLESYLEE